MIRALLRLVILLIVLVAVGGFLLGWWSGHGWWRPSVQGHPIGTTGQIDASKAREAGAQLGERAAKAANQAETAVAEGSLTAKIKAKMALDDRVRARDITVSTSNGVVTLTGVVSSEDERQRALQLARETNGVSSVVDHLRVSGKAPAPR